MDTQKAQLTEGGQPSSPEQPPEEPAADEEIETGSFRTAHIWFLVASFVTVVGVLLFVWLTRAWDPFVCSTNQDCHGLKRCFQGQCVSPEIWLNDIDAVCREALEIDQPCIAPGAWEQIE